jgi:DNA polymerase III subunit delta'
MDLSHAPWFPNLSRLVQNRDKQAFLIESTPNSGLEPYGKLLANYLLCQTASNCGKCQQCLLIAASSHPDLFLVNVEEGKKQISINQVRILIEKLSKTPQVAASQVVVIYPADKMTIEACNALLKTLEEPTSTSNLMLLTHDSSALPITVRSRCQTWDAKPDQEQLQTWLVSALSEQGENISEQEAEVLAFRSLNQPLLSLQLGLKDVAVAWIQTFYDGANEIQLNSAQVNKIVKQLNSQKLSIYIDSLYLLVSTSLKQAPVCQITKHLKLVDENSRFNFLKYILKLKEDMLSRANVSPQLLLETLMISWAELNKRIIKENGI